MVKPHHMMLGKRRHGHVFRIIYVLRRKSIFEPHFTTRFFVKSVGGRRRRRDAVLTATQGLWSYHLKSAQWSEIDFESLKNFSFFPTFFFFFFENVLEFAGILHFWGVDYLFPWTVQTIVHWCPRYYERGRLSQIFLSVCRVFFLVYSSTNRYNKEMQMSQNQNVYLEDMYFFYIST